MAVLERITRVRITSATGFREWQATADVLDTLAGGSVVVTVVMTTSGTTPPLSADSLTLRFHNDAGTQISTVSLTPDAASQTHSFHFTATGGAGGAARAGMVEIVLRAQNGSATPYDVESDGSPNTPGAGNTSQLDRGWVRGTTSATSVLSNVALGGGKSSPAAYDESLFVRTTLGAALYVARALTVTISGATPALSGATNSATSGNWDATFTNVVDERFPAASTTVNTSLTVPNATLTGQPDTVLTTTNDSMAVDPRLTASPHLWQVEDDVIGTPPMSKHEASKSALTSVYSGMAMRLVNVRGEGVNGVSTSLTFDPRSPGANIVRTSTTATRGGESGWTDLGQVGPFVVGGAWDVSLVVTAPADIDAAGYVVSNTDVVTILSPHPSIVLRGYVNKTTTQRKHFTAGDPVVASLTVMNLESRIRIDPVRVTEPRVSFVRYVSTTHQLETLRADNTWGLWEPTAAAHAFDLAPSPNDPRNYILEFASTATWTRDIMAVLFTAKVDGTPYSGFMAREETGGENGHDGYSLDPVGLALSGVLSMR